MPMLCTLEPGNASHKKESSVMLRTILARQVSNCSSRLGKADRDVCYNSRSMLIPVIMISVIIEHLWMSKRAYDSAGPEVSGAYA